MKLIRKNILFSMIIFLSLFIIGCDDKNTSGNNEIYSKVSNNHTKTYVFGIHPLLNSKKLFEVYQPMVDKINKSLENGTIKLESSVNYAAFNDKMIAGHFDFALPNPYQTIESLKYGYDVFGKMGDDQNFRGIILVRKDSGITKITDLIGKTVSYPAPTALAATMMPQYYLQTHGIDINKDIKNRYVGTHGSSIMNVYLGNSTASATYPLAWKSYIKENPDVAEKVKIQWQTEHLINNGLIVKKGTPSEVLDVFSKVTFNLHNYEDGKKILSFMEVSKYEKANNKTFEIVNVFLNKFKNTVRPLDIGK